MPYSVKEIFYTLQGEGAQAGSAAVFCRFAGCNLWSGREEDRKNAVCRFCDTDFVGTDGDGGGKFDDARALAETIAEKWPAGRNENKLVVCTGGEPLLQLDTCLLEELHRRNFRVAIETNGTLPVPAGVDWVCVSPKAGTTLRVVEGDEIKVVYPQSVLPEEYEGLGFRHFFVQAMDGPEAAKNLQAATDFCLQHPKWRLSLQTHKLLGIR